MAAVALEIVLILALVLLNGLFAMTEIAVVSARRARLKKRADEGDPRAAAALALASAPNDFLSTVQIGITLVGIFTGAFGGATLAEQIEEALADVPRLAPYAPAIGIGIVVVALTYLSLVLGELLPKRIALGAPERIASAVARPMRLLARIASPLVRLLSWSTELGLRLLGMKPGDELAVTEEEVRVLLDVGTQSGMFHRSERAMIDAVFRLGDRRVGAIMTLRPSSWRST